MFTNSQLRDGHLSSLNTAIGVLNLAMEDTGIQLRAATGAVLKDTVFKWDALTCTRDLLIMIRVCFFFFCDNGLPVYL